MPGSQEVFQVQVEQINALIKQHIPDADVSADGDGSHFQATIISDVFEGMSRVKRQQHVYGAVMAEITDGSIHALTIRAYTAAEWAAQSGQE